MGKAWLLRTGVIFYLCIISFHVFLTHDQNLQITADLADAPPKVITDALRFQQIVTNLVSNAIRYTPSGRVAVKCYVVEN
ncbi:hypothetical protein [Gloeocapsopsis dulcis]|uniref:hypothetical protein n=1 Tax=Gloeocapsopsis dulcis TaxID=2859516 RepID=UPI0018C6B0AA|nr:hypothetical protein [Gloeocapsopsis dulcis]WNN87612.1 hypothetical protein P0S91_14940 [Gloeocapsopsis dulcis]